MPKEPQQNIEGIDEFPDMPLEKDRIADRSYYYDDAHGYEEFDPRKEEEDKEAEELDD